MVFGNVGRRDQNDRLAQEAELRNGSGASPRDDQVSQCVGTVHVLDKIGHIQVGQATDTSVADSFTCKCRNGGFHLFDVYLAGLPDELYFGVGFDLCQSGCQCLIDSTGSQTASQNQDGLPARVETEQMGRFFTRNRVVEQGLSHGITRQQNLLGREELFHSFVGHANAVSFLSQQLVGHSRI